MRSQPRALAIAAALCAAFLAAAGPAPAQQAPDAFAPAAFVDGQAITNFDVDQRARLLEFAGVTEGRDADAALRSMIDDRLKRRAAQQAGLEIPQERMNEGLGRFAAAQGLDGPAQLEARLKRAGISFDVAREFVKTEILWTQLIQRDFGPRATVSEQELDEEIEASGIDVAVSYELGEIARAARGNPQETMARMREIAAELRAGADFEATARRVSQSPTAPRGGRLGWTPESKLPPPLRARLAEMAPGDVTDPFAVQGGVILLGLFDKREEKREITPEQREQLRRQLIDRRLSRLAEGRLQELRARAYVEER